MMSRIFAISLILAVSTASASACVRASAFEGASPEEQGRLQSLDEQCRRGLSMLLEGRYGEALGLLMASAQLGDTLSEPLDLPLAEAMFGAGAPVDATLQAWEKLRKPASLVAARRAELVERLMAGQAQAMLEEDDGRPAAPLLKRRARRDVEEPAPAIQVVKPERFGVLLPLTGKLAPLGQALLTGIQLALNERTVLLVRDVPGGRSAVTRAVRELTAEGALALLGPVDRARARVAAEAAQASQIPLLRLSVEDEGSQARPWVFRAFISRRSRYRALIERARLEGVKRFAIMHPETPWGRALADAFEAEVKASGSRLATRQSYPPAATNLGRVTQKVSRRRFGAIFIAEKAARAPLVLRFLASEDVWTRGKRVRLAASEETRYVQVFGPAEWLQAPIGADDVRYLSGALVATEWPGAEHPSVAEFVSMGTERLGKRPGLLEVVGYDAMTILQEAADTRRGVAEALRRSVGWPGVLGRTRFDEFGEPSRKPRLYRAVGGGYKVVRSRR